MAALVGHDPDSPEAFDSITDAVVALFSRSAAEPPEHHGVRWVHPGCGECQKVARVLTGWRGVAAEPNEEPG